MSADRVAKCLPACKWDFFQGAPLAPREHAPGCPNAGPNRSAVQEVGTGRFAYPRDAPSLKLLPESAGVKEYRKTATVHAMRMDRPFAVETLEGTMHGEAGDYLCEGPAGERWPIKRAIFEATYVEEVEKR